MRENIRESINSIVPKCLTALDSFPLEIKQKIHLQAQESGRKFQEFICSQLKAIARQPTPSTGITIIWDTLYNYDHPAECPRIKPTCQEIPLEREKCTCNLIYSIPRVNIDLAKYQPIPLIYQGKIINLDHQILLDYGFLRELIIENPEQTN